eukprot:2534179-Prymnesium_polylepis.1
MTSLECHWGAAGLRACVLLVYGDACVCVNGLRGRGTRTWHACETRERQGGGTLSFTVRVPPLSAVVHHAGLREGEAEAARPGRAA